jgi:hypothetical protein
VGIGERAAVREEGVGLVGETQEMHKKVGFRILVRYGESVIRASEWVLEESERWVLWRGGRERRRELGLLVLWGSDRQSRKSREVGVTQTRGECQTVGEGGGRRVVGRPWHDGTHPGVECCSAGGVGILSLTS